MVINVEYNQLDPLLRASGYVDGDANCETGFSPFPGNINQVFVIARGCFYHYSLTQLYVSLPAYNQFFFFCNILMQLASCECYIFSSVRWIKKWQYLLDWSYKFLTTLMIPLFPVLIVKGILLQLKLRISCVDGVLVRVEGCSTTQYLSSLGAYLLVHAPTSDLMHAPKIFFPIFWQISSLDTIFLVIFF